MENETMTESTNCLNSLGPIPKWVRRFWLGDKPYPKYSLAERNARAGRAATDHRAATDLAEGCPWFGESAFYELIYIDRSGGISRDHTLGATETIFSSRDMAVIHALKHGYKRLSSHDTPVKIAYERAPNK